MNEFLLGFQGGQSIRMQTSESTESVIGAIAEALKSAKPNTVIWHQGHGGLLINLSHLSYIAPSNTSSLEATDNRP